MSAAKQAGTVRERLLRSADDLFYRDGIHVVGIDRILAHAGVAKASLYDNFKSKDELVRAYLEDRATWLHGRIDDRVAAATAPSDRIVAVFDEFVDRVEGEERYWGCPFIRACAEGGDEPTAAREVSLAHRRWQRELFTRLAKDAGARKADGLSLQLCLIYDGATVAVAMDGEPDAASAAREVVKELLAKVGRAASVRTSPKTSARRARATKKSL